MNKYDFVRNYHFSAPLKKNLWKKYDEALCLLILRVLFYPKYEKYSLSDSPDIISNDEKIGIEVTRAVDEVDAEIESLFVKYNHSFDEKRKAEWKKQIEKKGAHCDNHILTQGCRDEQSFLNPFCKVVSKKVLKIGEYRNKKVEKLFGIFPKKFPVG